MIYTNCRNKIDKLVGIFLWNLVDRPTILTFCNHCTTYYESREERRKNYYWKELLVYEPTDRI